MNTNTTLTVAQLIDLLNRFPADLQVQFGLDGFGGNVTANQVDTFTTRDGKTSLMLNLDR